MSKPARRYSGGEAATQLRAELDRLFQEVMAASETVQRGGWTPALDVVDSGTALVLVLEVAGLAAADLRVEVEGSTVRVKGRRRLTFPVPGRIRFHCLERQEGRFVREVEVLEPVDFRSARATLQDGLLRLELPKIEERRRRLQIIEIAEVADEEPAAAQRSAASGEEPGG